MRVKCLPQTLQGKLRPLGRPNLNLTDDINLKKSIGDKIIFSKKIFSHAVVSNGAEVKYDDSENKISD